MPKIDFAKPPASTSFEDILQEQQCLLLLLCRLVYVPARGGGALRTDLLLHILQEAVGEGKGGGRGSQASEGEGGGTSSRATAYSCSTPENAQGKLEPTAVRSLFLREGPSAENLD